jgi:hypothetical protein
MRHSVRQLSTKELKSKSTNNLLQKIKRELTPPVLPPAKKSLPKLSKESIRSGVESLNKNKRYSILSVPKTPNTYSAISQGTTPSKQSETSESLNVSHIEDSSRTTSQSAYSLNFKFSNKNSRIRIGNRYRKNPNQENLKQALQEIEKNPSKLKTSENKEKLTQIISHKSDIEVLLESQGNVNRTKSLEKGKNDAFKPKGLLELKESQKEIIEMSVEVESMVSDPSPVREKKIDLKVCQTPKRKKFNQNKMLGFLTRSKAGREFIEKFQDQSIFDIDEPLPCPSKENINKTLIDYRQESLKILKDTSFFANKIMKAIRCPGRIKKCYYAN